MDTRRALSILRKYWILIVILVIVGGGAGFGYSYTSQPLYRATSSVFVSSQRGQTTSELVQGSTFVQDLVQSYAQLAVLPAVLTPVIRELGLHESAHTLAKSVTADSPLDTVIIAIQVTDTSPARAATIANAVSASLATVAEKLAPQGTDGTASVTLSVVAKAAIPTASFAPDRKLLAATGALIGLVLALIFAFLRELLDTRIRNESSVSVITDVPVAGAISAQKLGAGTTGIVMRHDKHSLAAEDFRRLRTNLEFASIDEPARAILVTSALASEGKTTITVNLALAIAEDHKKVLLVDADLRRPSVAGMTQLEGSIGLTSVLVGTSTLAEAIQPWAGGMIDILPGGFVPSNPNQLLSSAAMATLVKKLVAKYDYVIFDSPPLLPFTDSLSLSRLMDGVIVVARAKQTRSERLAKALASLEVVQARILGLVLNEVVPIETASYYSYRGVQSRKGDSWVLESPEPLEANDELPVR